MESEVLHAAQLVLNGPGGPRCAPLAVHLHGVSPIKTQCGLGLGLSGRALA